MTSSSPETPVAFCSSRRSRTSRRSCGTSAREVGLDRHPWGDEPAAEREAGRYRKHPARGSGSRRRVPRCRRRRRACRRGRAGAGPSRRPRVLSPASSPRVLPAACRSIPGPRRGLRSRGVPAAAPPAEGASLALRLSDSAAKPAVRASRKAIPTPATSISPKPRTIGTGESSSTQKPGRRRQAGGADHRPSAGGRDPRRVGAAGTGRLGLVEAGLELDRVVDREPDQDRQHRDRGDRQRAAEQTRRARR